MTGKPSLGDKPFSYRATQNGRILISYRGRLVTTLAGKTASRFAATIESADSSAAQLAMAKATGHFKHGNERRSKPTEP